MTRLTHSLAKAVDRHASELILLAISIPYMIGYWKTRDQLLGTLTIMLVSGAIALMKKQNAQTTNVENIETVNTKQTPQEKP